MVSKQPPPSQLKSTGTQCVSISFFSVNKRIVGTSIFTSNRICTFNVTVNAGTPLVLGSEPPALLVTCYLQVRLREEKQPAVSSVGVSMWKRGAQTFQHLLGDNECKGYDPCMMRCRTSSLFSQHSLLHNQERNFPSGFPNV